MLTLARKLTENVIVDLRKFGLGLAKVSVAEIRGNKVKIGFEFDPRIPVHREEVFDAIERTREAGCAGA